MSIQDDVSLESCKLSGSIQIEVASTARTLFMVISYSKSCKSNGSIQVEGTSTVRCAFKLSSPWRVEVTSTTRRALKLQVEVAWTARQEFKAMFFSKNCKSSGSSQVEVALTARQAFKLMSP
ncbi:hypothetical protein ACH5RR_015930 [Cinchona calisaya]|uniref:Uncharacterized protein n=1 Tax=Cinchona calisaya TaxID=153742 RepID=A0ABD2ZUG6_9GENT